VYACKDGRRYALGALEPKFWHRFCEAVARRTWVDRGFDRALVPDVDALFATRTREEWDALLCSADCCGEPVLEPSELREHPVFAGLYAGGLPRTYPALVPTLDLPVRRAPQPGEHTAEVLREWVTR
jgi:crotonobetainyl-CoA:carnitine CoA-transferase CaiB-like acyl-CoA transferase